MNNKEKNIKSKNRVQNHGEVFTPKRIVKKILDMPRLRELSSDITSTFLEPAVGEGIFLVEVLSRKLKNAEKIAQGDMVVFENYALLSLSTVYGVELLEDNAQKCVMNLYHCFYNYYLKMQKESNTKIKKKVLDSAKLIISNNIVQGNFLTKKTSEGRSIVFSEWKPLNLNRCTKALKVQRTEYTLESILEGTNEVGYTNNPKTRVEQLDIFSDGFLDEDFDDVPMNEEKIFKYVAVKITDVYKEEMEELSNE